MFFNCPLVSNVTVASNVAIPAYSFVISTLNRPDAASSTGVITIGDGVTIGREAFGNMNQFGSVVLGADVEVGQEAFNNCDGIEDLRVGANVSFLTQAFTNCDGIEELTLPGGANSGLTIGPKAFIGCNQLARINIPEGVSVGTEAFNQLPSLATVTVGADVQIAARPNATLVITRMGGGGDCVLSDDGQCVSSRTSSTSYDRYDSCTVQVQGNSAILSSTRFSLGIGDHVTLNGRQYRSSTGPSRVQLSQAASFAWYADYSRASTGWQICVDAAPTKGVFSGSPLLSSVTIGANVTVGAGAFMYSPGLTSVVLPTEEESAELVLGA